MKKYRELLEMTDEERAREMDQEYLWNKGIEATILTSEIACRSTDVLMGAMTKEQAYDAIIAAYHHYLDNLTDDQKRFDKKYELLKYMTYNRRI